LGLGELRLASAQPLVGREAHADVAVKADGATIAPESSRIGAIDIETSIRRPSWPNRWVSTCRTTSPRAPSPADPAIGRDAPAARASRFDDPSASCGA
jgi:hypothetical protein